MQKSELNALINGVYGDLYSLNSNRDNFKNDVKNTQAYNIYIFIRDNLRMLDKLTNEDWDNVRKAFNLLSADGSKQTIDISSFKNRFKTFTIRKLNNLMKGIGRISSFYYDKKESFENNDDVLTLNDPSIELTI